MSRASSLCKVRISRRSRSYSSAQRWRSARASTNCAVTRTRLLERDTEPSTTASTLKARAMSGSGRREFLYCMIEVREMTRSPGNLANCVMRASVIPSAKYSCDGSPDKFSRGSTAIEWTEAALPAFVSRLSLRYACPGFDLASAGARGHREWGLHGSQHKHDLYGCAVPVQR